MAKLRLSTSARQDLIEIRKYSFGEFGGDVADTYMRGFKAAFQVLRERPFAGSAQSEINPALRRYTYRSHRIFYTFDRETVHIVRIIHHAQNVQRVLNG